MSAFFFPLSFLLNICYIVGGRKKNKMAEQTACKWGAKKKKKKKGQGWRSRRQGTDRKQRRIKQRGGRGAERGSPRQKSKQRWLQERHFSATSKAGDVPYSSSARLAFELKTASAAPAAMKREGFLPAAARPRLSRMLTGLCLASASPPPHARPGNAPLPERTSCPAMARR